MKIWLAMLVSLFQVLLPNSLIAEPITEFDLKKDFNGYPCFLTMSTSEGRGVGVQLSNYKDVWSLNFFVSGVPEKYVAFYDHMGLRDEKKFDKAFRKILIGASEFDVNDSTLWEVRKSKVDEKTSGMFVVSQRHNVSRAIEAMKDEGLSIRGLISTSDTVDSMAEFRACAMKVLGLNEGELVETDFRAEYRLVFEDAFGDWIRLLAMAEACGVLRFDDQAVFDAISQAGSAFYPGVLNSLKRREYRENLSRGIAVFKFQGTADAVSRGCLMAGNLSDAARSLVDSAIGAAMKLD